MSDLFNENKEFDIHELEWFLPSPPKPIFSIIVSNEKGFCLNSKLNEFIPKQLTVGISPDGKHIGLKTIAEKGYQVLKNGKIKDPELLHLIETRGISLPASYIVRKEEDLWLATLVPSKPVSPTPRKTPRNPRKNGLRDMLPKKDKN
ncbi:hypothetical protein [Paenibacillus riograndensis]|uniref:Uncharacterized protein n=1 Tax=Paenibacillus riograndensis SBR5 TaxID=1073571 RepID=A0A0E3WG15_9BACL|nr:hypothetical protein [Paenibacillus riograndensis]CQR51563.1 hypothetical protein PRIO_0310 [Paenibacillus riograndensis SBR5]